ncbi:prolyl aminopeptidase [Candidatus Saccharibacteria bacterium]|nr:prolyl aminopeptidase [Candidatus Saccharibacteria bacterium]
MAKAKTIDPYVRKNGHLSVGDGHEIYWEDWGNPRGFPILHLHGGPGAGFNEKHKLLYNPNKHRVIFHDQRGCGKSKPFADISDNTTQHLISDIEKLREHLGIDKAYISGGSWGSTLTMLYAIAYPRRVEKMMMWGIFLLRQSEIDYLYQGVPKHTFPEAWTRFISLVPPRKRTSSKKVIDFYAAKIQSKDKKTALKYAAEWNLWESSTISLSYDLSATEREVFDDPDYNLAISKMESHYFKNGCFVPENYIIKNIRKINHIPCYVIQGRFDMCTPPVSAIDLASAYGEKLNLQIVRAGHLRTEPETLTALRSIALTELI